MCDYRIAQGFISDARITSLQEIADVANLQVLGAVATWTRRIGAINQEFSASQAGGWLLSHSSAKELLRELDFDTYWRWEGDDLRQLRERLEMHVKNLGASS